MSENHDVVCFAPNDWWGMNPSCATHYMLRFARDRKVLWINPFSSDLGGLKQGLGRRIVRKGKSLAKYLRNPVENLYVYSPLFLPFHGNVAVDTLNNSFLKWQIGRICQKTGLENTIVWIENPRAYDILNRLDYRRIVYHVSDHFSKCRYIKNKQALERRENELSQKSDLIVAVSQSIYDLKKEYKNVKYLPHGVDFELFFEAAKSPQVLPEIAGIAKPIVGYYGTLSSSNDIVLWHYCASKLKSCSFVFAGQITGGDYDKLSSLSNVFFLGRMPYQKIPLLCAGFDVCMLQWKMTDWIAACNPLKTMEYMASGKPIVSVPIKCIVDNYRDVVSIAGTKEEFCAAIEWELQNDTKERSERRVEIARKHSWESNFGMIRTWIDELLGDVKKR